MINWSKAVNDLTSLSVDGGSKYWIKRRERFKLKHIFKRSSCEGNKKRARWYKSTQEMGIPAPNVVYEDERCIVTEDVGPNLQDIAVDKRIGVAEKEKIFQLLGRYWQPYISKDMLTAAWPLFAGMGPLDTIRSGVF